MELYDNYGRFQKDVNEQWLTDAAKTHTVQPVTRVVFPESKPILAVFFEIRGQVRWWVLHPIPADPAKKRK